MAGNEIAQSLPLLEDKDCGHLFEEAIQGKMVPYDFRVWSRYLFDKCHPMHIEHIVNIFWDLLNVHNVGAADIGTWCLKGVFYDEAMKKIPVAHLRSSSRDFLTNYRDKLNALPNDYPSVVIDRESDLQKRWHEQSQYCFTSAKCQLMGLDSRRYCYLVMGMIVWEIRPEKHRASHPPYGNFDPYSDLGYDIVSDKRLSMKNLSEVYRAALSQHRGVSHISFKKFNDGTTATTKILERINRDSTLRVYTDLLSKITTFFAKIPHGKGDSVWPLKQALRSGITWEKMGNFGFFEDAAQDYGYTTLHQYKNTKVDITGVANNLRAAYLLVLDHDPMALHRACKETFDLQVLVPNLCRDNRLPLLPKTVEVLQNADGINIQPQSIGELYKTQGVVVDR